MIMCLKYIVSGVKYFVQHVKCVVLYIPKILSFVIIQRKRSDSRIEEKVSCREEKATRYENISSQ